MIPNSILHVVILAACAASPTPPPDPLPANTPAIPFTDSDFILRPDSIMLPIAHTQINPDYVTLTKLIDLTNLREAADILDDLTNQHRQLCATIHNDHSAMPTYKNMDPSQTYYRDELILLCKQHGMTLPRPQTTGQMEDLKAFMKENGHEHVITDATSTSYWPHIDKGRTIRYPDGTSPFLGIKHYKAQQTAKYEGTDQDTQFGFKYNYGNMDFLPLEKTYMPAICQTTKPVQDLEGEVALCHARTEDMLQSSLSIESALDSLITGKPIHESLLDDTTNNGTHTGQRSRQGRIIISGTVATTIAAVTLLVSTITSITAIAKTTSNTMAISSLEIDLTDIKDEHERFAHETKEVLRHLQDLHNLILHETRIYASSTTLKLSLQDNIITYTTIMQSVRYKQYSPLILSQTELTRLQHDVFGQTAQKLSPQASSYMIEPVMLDGRLAVNIIIPLLDPSREATIFRLIPDRKSVV